MRDAGGKSSRRRQALRLQQLIHHFAPMGNIAQNHVDELLIAECNQGRVLIEEEWTQRQVERLLGTLAHHGAEMFQRACAALGGHKIRNRTAD